MVSAQIDSIIRDFDIVATKTGMLACPETVRLVAKFAIEGSLPRLVVDPVIVSSTGSLLLSDGGLEAYREELIPASYLLTPNLREAAALTSTEVGDIKSVEDMIAIGRLLQGLGIDQVLVKGGHYLEGLASEAPDVLLSNENVMLFTGPRIDTTNDHGTGCSLSAAIVSGLALQRNLDESIRDAKSFVLAALEGARTWQLGQGRGPIDHLGWSE
jgi:hydroxymethylpyrimidine kinase/phosphomethylpyrimidine kinase